MRNSIQLLLQKISRRFRLSNLSFFPFDCGLTKISQLSNVILGGIWLQLSCSTSSLLRRKDLIWSTTRKPPSFFPSKNSIAYTHAQELFLWWPDMDFWWACRKVHPNSHLQRMIFFIQFQAGWRMHRLLGTRTIPSCWYKIYHQIIFSKISVLMTVDHLLFWTRPALILAIFLTKFLRYVRRWVRFGLMCRWGHYNFLLWEEDLKEKIT